MNLKKIISNAWVRGGLFILAGLLLGWLLFHRSGETVTTSQQGEAIHEHSEEEHNIWTCSMHPQIRQDKPGQCPICGMDLVPLHDNHAVTDDDAISMSEAAMKLAEVQTAIVTRGQASKEVLLYGKVQASEQLLRSQAAHVPGRIEKLLVNFTGETIESGQLIATVYSPELVTAQKELTEAMTLSDRYPALMEAAREKLRGWKLSDRQISEIETTGTITSNFDIYANTTGVVTGRNVSEGDYVQKGSVLFTVADLSQVWGVFEAYESDLPWIKLNQEVEFTARAVPGKTFKGRVSFIDPVIDPATRTARVRVTLANPGMVLKPEMLINGTVRATLKNARNELIIPQSAVLWTGTRSLVYIKVPETDQPAFKMREITLGEVMKDTYVVKEGLEEGEEIVVNGTFSVDAAAQLAGKRAMMNTGGGRANARQGDGEMEMAGGSVTGTRGDPDMKTNAPGKPGGHSMDAVPVHAEFRVSGNCEMCKERIEKAAGEVEGVNSAVWDADSKQLHVSFNQGKTSLREIHRAIAKAGHDTELEKADDEVYKNLPECCHYVRE